MPKELPFFKFYPAEWLVGDITLEPLDVQGFFINLCAFYWAKDCDICSKDVDKRLIRGSENSKKLYENLKKLGFFSEKHGKISIEFLDEQYKELAQAKVKQIIGGHKGAQVRYRQPIGTLSHLDKDKDKDKEADPNDYIKRKTKELERRFRIEEKQKKKFIPKPKP